MKRSLYCFATAGLLAASSASADLILTGVIDGPLAGGNPKAFEVYATADIPDLSIYSFEIGSNGALFDTGALVPLSGSMSAGDYYYVASETPGFEAFFGFAPDLLGSVFINGDDTVGLFKNGALVDVYGVEGVDGSGSNWEHLDSWAYRVDGTGPSTTFGVSEWTVSPINSLDGLTTNGGAVPFGTYVPEPGSLALLGLGGLLIARRRQA